MNFALVITTLCSELIIALFCMYDDLCVFNFWQVKVEKFITPEQQAKLDEEAKVEEERKLKEKGDNARDRALNMMMGGVLEIKKEDELKKVMFYLSCPKYCYG